MRQINKEWRTYCNINCKELLPKENKGRPSKKRKAEEKSPDADIVHSDALFDIGRDTSGLTSNEKIFYEDQRGPKQHSISEEVDVEFEEERAVTIMEQAKQNKYDAACQDHSNPSEFQEVQSPDVLNRSREEQHMKRSVLFETASICDEHTDTWSWRSGWTIHQT